MLRKCNHKTFLDNDVSYDVLKDSSGAPASPSDLIAYQSLSKVLIPFQVKITKAKDGIKDLSRYSLFCVENLRIYDSVEVYIQDRPQLKINTKNLENDINQMSINVSLFEQNIDFMSEEDQFS
jgi:hypothetical protein